MSKNLASKLLELCSAEVSHSDHSRACWHLLDWIGIAAAAAKKPAGILAIDYAKSIKTTHSGQCSVVGVGQSDAEMAAFVHGMLGNVLEMDDLHRSSILHAGNVIIPTVLAAVEETDCAPEVFTRAIVIGYEIALRIGIAAAKGGYTNWYNSGTCSIFGATVAAAVIYDLDHEAMCGAFGNAGMQASGVWQCRLDPGYGKQMVCGHASRAAISATRLAKIGFVGPARILEGELGFFKSFYPQSDFETLASVTSDPTSDGHRWHIHEVSFKPWPACRHTHPVIEAALVLRDQYNSHECDRITVTTYQAGADFCDNSSPINDSEARFSFQHLVAFTLCNGKPSLTSCDQNMIQNHDIQALRKIIDVEVDRKLSAAFPNQISGSVTFHCKNGGTISHHVEHALGDPENPLSKGELIAKFRANSAFAGVEDDVATLLIDTVFSLPDAKNLYEFTSAIRNFFDAIEPT